MSWKQIISDEDSNTDATRSDADLNEAVSEGRLCAVHWDDLLVDATTLSHLKKTGRGFIKINLGYLPPDTVMMPFEPYLRALIQMHWQEVIDEDDFLQQSEDHCKLIRNADMKHNTSLTYDKAIYDNYNETFAAYGYVIRDRLSRFLGYVPQLEHSLLSEMWMRDIASDDIYRLPNEMTPDDIRAMTLIKYREVLLQDGQSEADQSPLLPELIDIP